jgi:hypothetical protein
MPKLIMRDRQLGIVARQLVTDANGAPCCCGGVCCPAEAPCLPTPYVRCDAGGLMAFDNCPQNRGYRMRVTSSWRSLLRRRQTNIVIRENGQPRLVNELVQAAQFALTATADYCVSSDPAGTENQIARLIVGTMRLEGATFQNVTADGGSIFELAAAGEVLIPQGPATSDLLPVVNQAGNLPPVVVELLRGAVLPDAPFLYPIGASGGNAGQPGTRSGPSLIPGTTPCASSTRYDRWTSDQYRFEDACSGGRFTWSTVTEALPGQFPSVSVTDYTASLETTWAREFCPCGGGPTELTGGGCSNCGDRSQLEVIE